MASFLLSPLELATAILTLIYVGRLVLHPDLFEQSQEQVVLRERRSLLGQKVTRR